MICIQFKARNNLSTTNAVRQTKGEAGTCQVELLARVIAGIVNYVPSCFLICRPLWGLRSLHSFCSLPQVIINIRSYSETLSKPTSIVLILFDIFLFLYPLLAE